MITFPNDIGYVTICSSNSTHKLVQLTLVAFPTKYKIPKMIYSSKNLQFVTCVMRSSKYLSLDSNRDDISYLQRLHLLPGIEAVGHKCSLFS